MLLNQPIFPEVAGNGLFTLTSPGAGQLRIAAGTTWTHRGAFTYTSVQTDLATAANKTYHLRWGRVNGFALYDLSSGAYNPSSVPETDATFDTTYDSMLVARVVTSAGNVLTVTPLINKAALSASIAMTPGPLVAPSLNLSRQSQTADYNWSRTPSQKAFSRVQLNVDDNAGNDRDENLYSVYPTEIFVIPATRYQSSFVYGVDFMAAPGANLVLSIGA